MFKWPWSKPKEPVKTLKKTHYQSLVELEFNKTHIDITFADGSRITTTLYGEFETYYGFISATANPQDFVSSSRQKAQYYVTNYDGNKTTVVVDDPKNVRFSRSGVIVKAELSATILYKQTIPVDFVKEEYV